MRTLIIVLVLLGVLLSQSVVGQTITGYVYAKDTGEPLSGATVQLINQPNQGAHVDEEGAFVLTQTEQSDSIWISYLGYKDWIGPVLTDSQMIVAMMPLVLTAAHIVVKAERRPAQLFATQQLKRLDIYLNAAAKADVLLAVNSLAAATNPDETANVSLRGSPPDATGIFFNNVILKDVVRLDQPNGVGQFSIFNTAILNGLDIYPSNPPLYLGQSASGAISIRTTERLQTKAKALSLHLAGGGLQAGFSLGQQTNLLVYANHGNQQLLKAANPDALKNLERFVSNDLGLFLTHQFSERARLVLFNLSIFERYNFNLHEGRFEGLFTQRKNRNQTVVNYIYQAANWRLSWNQGFNTSQATYQSGNINTNLQLLDYTTNLLWHWQSRQWNGTAALHYSIYRNKAAGSYPLYNGAWEADDPAAFYQDENSNGLPELAAFAKRKLNTNNTIGFGLRSGYSNSVQQWLHGAQASWHHRLGSAQELILASGRYHQQSPGRQGAVSAINNSYQLALDWKWTPQQWEINLAVYRHWAQWQEQKNLIFGTEATLSYKSYPLQSSLSLSRVVSRLRNDSGSYPSGYDFGYLIRWQMQYQLPANITWNAALSWREGKYHQPLIDRQWNHQLEDWTPLFNSALNGERLPAYFRLDAGLSRPFLIGDGVLIAFLNVNNVSNRSNVRSYAYDASYQTTTELFYSQLVWFVGGVYQWE